VGGIRVGREPSKRVASTGAFTLAPILVLALASGCGPDRARRAEIEAAIEWSDSLRRRPFPGVNRTIPLDVPIAATADSDSVTFVKIDYRRQRPRGHTTLIDGGPADPPVSLPERR